LAELGIWTALGCGRQAMLHNKFVQAKSQGVQIESTCAHYLLRWCAVGSHDKQALCALLQAWHS